MSTTTTAIQTSAARSRFWAVGSAMLLGLSLIVLSGHVQAAALHDAAHDVRHATGFPCH